MNNKTDIPPRAIKSGWARLAFSIGLAFSLALILLMIPVTAGPTIRLPMPDQLLPSQPSWQTGRAIELSLPFGASLVRATNGLTITKTAPPTVDQGSILTYTLIAANQTGQDLTDALITDTIPSNTACQYVINPSLPPVWSSNCSSVALWDLIYIPAIPFFSVPFANNTANVFTFTVFVDEPLPDQFEIINNSYVISATDDVTIYTDVGIPLTTRVNAPSWVITKTVSSDTVQPGDLLTYTITLTNNGHLASSGPYTITDPLPNNTTFVSGSATPPESSFDGSTLTWVLTNPVGINESIDVSYAVTVTQPLTDGAKIVNQNYTVGGGNVFTPTTVGEPITVTVESPATLSIAKTASPNPVQAGDLLTYTITITNDATSKGPVDGVMISDTLASELFDQSAGFVGAATGVVTATGNPVLWALADPIPVGDSVQVTVTARVTSPILPRLITNTFAAWATNAPLVSDTLTTQITSTNIISLSKSVDPTVVAPGDPVTYTITLTNSGNSIATIDLADVLHPDFTPLTYTLSGLTLPGRTPFTTENTTGVVFTATAPLTPGTYYNQIITATYDLTQAVISNIAPVRVVSAAITLTKTAEPSPAAIGDTIAYTYTVTNQGDITLTDIILLDEPLGSISLLTTTLGPAESTTGTASYPLTEGDLPGPITNTATVTGTYLTNNLVSTTTMASVPISYTTAITIDKSYTTSGGVPATLGDTITYTYRITNVGTVTLNDITLFDDKLGALAIPSTLTPSQGTEVTSTTQVQAGDLASLLLTNLATVTGTNNTVAQTAIATATASVPLTYTASITVDKSYTTSAGLPARVGDTITYTYRITNTSDVTLTLELFDDLLGPIPPLSTTLGPGEPTTATFVKNVTQTDLPGPIVNTATVTGTNPLYAPAVATATASVSLAYTTAISLEKTVNVSSATIGDVITYTYRITNTGDTTLSNLTLVDDRLGPISLSTTSLLPGFPTTKEVSHTVSLADFPSPLINTATVSGTDFATNTYTDTATTTVVLVYTPTLQLVKTANVSVAAPGDTITYTYYITNTGNVTLTNLILTDNQLGPITNLGATTLAPAIGTTGSATYTVLITDIPAITNTAIVTGEDIFGSNTSISDTLVVAVEEILTTIATTNSSPTIVNDTTFFTVTTNLIDSGITYTWNFGDGSAPAIVPISTTSHIYTTVGVYTAVVTASNAVSTITDTTVVTITPGPLDHFLLTAASPQTAGVPFPITITAQDSYGNTITDFNGPVTISDDTGTIAPTTAVLVNGITTTNFIVTQATAPQADVITATAGIISGTVGVVIRPNVPFTLTVTASPTAMRICETGIATATLTDQWNNPTPGVTVTLGQGGSGSVTFLPPSSGPTNSAGLFTATFQAATSGSVNISGFVAPSLLDDSPPIAISPPPIPNAITVTVTPDTVLVGGTATVQAQVGSCAGPVSGQVVTFTVGSLAAIAPPGTATTNATGVATTTVTGNTAGVTTITGTVEGPLVDTTPFTITVPTFPVLTITKTATPPGGNVRPGQSINYEIVVSNNGTGPANNVVITDALNSAVTFADGSIVPDGSGPVDTGGGVITFSVSSLAAGASVTATINTNVATAAVSGTIITNTATANSNEAGPVSSINVVTHRVVTDTTAVYLPIVLKGFAPLPPFDLTVRSVAVSNPNPNTGEPVVINITLHNTGTAFVTPFWVDLYLATTPINPAVNQTWEDNNGNGDPDDDDDIVPYGVAWKVGGMPADGDIIITNLIPNDLTEVNCFNYSNFIPNSVGCWPKTWKGIDLNNYFRDPGTYQLYVLADSLDDVPPTGNPAGIILESNESNNLFGPIPINVSGPSLSVAGPSTAQELKPFTGDGRQVVRP